MRVIKFLLQKEFLQIFRNKGMLPIMFVMPIIQLLILSNAATFDVKNVSYMLVDQDRSSFSHDLSNAFEASSYFTLIAATPQQQDGIELILENRIAMALVIPKGFEKDIINGRTAEIQFIVDAQDGYSAGIIQTYSNTILEKFMGETLPKQLSPARINTQLQTAQGIDIRQQSWYNPEMDYRIYMVPGILVILVTMIGLFLSGMNIVREREIGTIEQLNVSPIKKWQFIVGKLLPFWIIGQVELTIGIIIGMTVFHVPMEGAFWVIYLVTAIYLVVVLGIGLLISTITDTQQQAMFVAWFLMVIFVLMSGLFTPIESMPVWAQKITTFNPVRYVVDIMRRIMLKGSGWTDINTEMAWLTLYGTVILALALNRYQKVTT